MEVSGNQMAWLPTLFHS